MALSNWLTRGEWNAVYFAGLKAALDGAPCDNLGDQMTLGIGALHRAGYKFRGINSDENGGYEKVVQVCGGNETCLAEMIDGSFDKPSRAREAIAFIAKERLPIDFGWLSDALAKFDADASRREEDSCPKKS